MKNKSMKTMYVTVLSIVSSVLFMSFTGKERHSTQYTVDLTKSKLEWVAKKVTGQHNGIIQLSQGTLSDNHGRLSGDFVIDMQTIEVLDLEGKMKDKLTGHLKSDDFFGVNSFPTSSFVLKAIEPAQENNRVLVRGDLTIKGKSNPLTFEASMTRLDNIISFSGTAIVDRSKYDVKYGSESFFGELGDKAIYDDFEVRFTIVAVTSASNQSTH